MEDSNLNDGLFVRKYTPSKNDFLSISVFFRTFKLQYKCDFDQRKWYEEREGSKLTQIRQA